jgi:hypothetical protein
MSEDLGNVRYFMICKNCSTCIKKVPKMILEKEFKENFEKIKRRKVGLSDILEEGGPLTSFFTILDDVNAIVIFKCLEPMCLLAHMMGQMKQNIYEQEKRHLRDNRIIVPKPEMVRKVSKK